MKQFTDRVGRSWTIAINVASIKRVKGLVQVDLAGIFNDGVKSLGALIEDPCKLVDVLFVLIQTQAQTLGVTDEDFGQAMGGDALLAATDAFLEELADFFPGPKAAKIKSLLAEIRKAAEMMESQAKIPNAETLVNLLMNSSGKVQASSESSPGPLRSAS